jgi:hypothetical protein
LFPPGRDDVEDPSIDRIRQLFVSGEPEEVQQGYLSVLTAGQNYAAGSTVPILGHAFERRPSGLIAPVESDPHLVDYIHVYMTITEYLGIGGDEREIARAVVGKVLGENTQLELLAQLSVLTAATQRKDLMNRLQALYESCLRPDARARFRAIILDAHEPRVFLARQCLLTAMKVVLTQPTAVATKGEIPPAMAAIMLSHAIGTLLSDEKGSQKEEELAAGVPLDTTLSVLQNSIFYQNDDLYSRLDRTLRLWIDYGQSLRREVPRKAPAQLFLEASGLEIEDALALAFAAFTRSLQWEPGEPYLLNHDLGVRVEAEKMAAFEGIVCPHGIEGFRESVRMATGFWDFLPFERSPVLHLDEGFLVLDPGLLIDRVTDGLFWIVNDYERNLGGDRASASWRRCYAEMVEQQAGDMLESLAPQSRQRAFFTEDDLAKAYGDGKRADFVLDDGEFLCAFEVVTTRFHSDTRLRGDHDRFRIDAERMILDKATQLDHTARNLLADDRALTGSDLKHRMIVPVVVSADGWPSNPFVAKYIAHLLDTNELLQHARIAPLGIVDPGELEMLEGLHEHRGLSPGLMLTRWKQSSMADLSLRNFVIREVGGFPASLRPTRMQARMGPFFQGMIGRLNIPNPEGRS